MKPDAKKALLAAAVLAVQCAGTGWLVWRYENIVRNGTEVRFDCTAYDPYDPLRGRYLRATVDGSCTNLLPRADGESWKQTYGAAVFAKLEQGTNAIWQITAVSDGIPDDGGLWIKPESAIVDHSVQRWEDGETREEYDKRRTASPFVARVFMPGRLFVNERLAPAAEKILREATSATGKKSVAVYRAKGGEIVITDIEIDGESVLALARAAERSRGGDAAR